VGVGLAQQRREVGAAAALGREAAQAGVAGRQRLDAAHAVLARHRHHAGLGAPRDRVELAREAREQRVVDRPRHVDDHPPEPAEGDAAAPRNHIKPEGHARMKAELARLLDVGRPDVVRVVSWAASNGDRS
jgi:hypothetical protein